MPMLWAMKCQKAERLFAQLTGWTIMNINKHPIYKAIYELGLEIENLPASEHATKLSVMCSNLVNPADLLYSQKENAIENAAKQIDLMAGEMLNDGEIYHAIAKRVRAMKTESV